jgi:hypothetical protein
MQLRTGTRRSLRGFIILLNTFYKGRNIGLVAFQLDVTGPKAFPVYIEAYPASQK